MTSQEAIVARLFEQV